MKIVPIFAKKLFAIFYENEIDNEYDRLMDLWSDPDYIFQFLKENKTDLSSKTSIKSTVLRILNDHARIDDLLIEISKSSDKKLSEFFKPLYNSEYQFKILSLQKGRRNLLRIYAVKIDDDTFVITGGAIKLTQKMQDRPHTIEELKKLNFTKQFLNENHIFDKDSFYEFLKEQDDDQ